MNIVVGYVQSDGDLTRQAEMVRSLMAAGCQTVRVEASRAPDKAFKPMLDAVGDFLGAGDQLLLPDVTHLGSSPSSAQAFVARLEARGAGVRMLDPPTADGRIRLVGPLLPTSEAGIAGPISGGRTVDAGTVRALSAHGFGPTQIARRLGVSRMTVWRKLAAAEA
ncbi:MAG TPA: helix-turn-helix domain-containing protein [Caulobacteraceae bacterium]